MARLTWVSPPRPPAGGTAGDQQAEARTGPGPDPAVTAEAAGSVLAVAEAADAAGKALAAGDLPAALGALETAREQAAQGRRAVKAAAFGRRAPAARPGALRNLVEEHLRKFPAPPSPGRQGAHPVGRCGRQHPGQAHRPRHRADGHRQAPHLPARPAPAASTLDAAGDPGTSAETATNAA